MSKIVTTPMLSHRSWVWHFKRPRSMGWPVIEIPRLQGELYRIAPAEIQVTVQESARLPEIHATSVRVREVGARHWLSLHLPGTERYASQYANVPDWMMEIVRAAEEESAGPAPKENV